MCHKRRFADSTAAHDAAAALGYREYPCTRCGGFHLTSDGQERVRLLSPAEQAVLIVAREPTGAYVEGAHVFDGEDREVAPASAAFHLASRRMVRVEPWGEIVPRKAAA